MSKKKHLIIGCGPAALSAVETMRCLECDDEIVVVSKEESLPYSPALLPYALAGKAGEDVLFPRGVAYFEERDVRFVMGKEVVRVVPDRKQVEYRGGEAENYDTLLIACGARPIAQAVEGSDGEDGVVTFHHVADYRRLDGLLKAGTDVTILGAGMVAVELAVALIERGCRVSVIGRGRALRAYFDEVSGGYLTGVLTEHGAAIRTGRSIDRVRRNVSGFEVVCAGGEVFSAGVVVSCLGVRPNLGLTRGSGISVNQGILVDRKMRTSAECVYSAGDVAEAPSFVDGRPGTCAILPAAIEQGKVAGANMAGNPADYDGWIPMNLLKFFGQSAFSVGVAMPGDGEGEILEKNDAERGRFGRLVFRDGKLVGAAFVNVDVDPGVILYLIKKRVSIGSYRQALLEQPVEVSRWLMLKAEGNVSA